MRGTLIAALLVVALLGTGIVWSSTAQPGWFFSFSKRADTSENIVLFTGDVFLGRAVERWIETTQQDPFYYLTDLFQTHERVVINFEAAIPETHIPTPDFNFTFSVSTTAIQTLKAASVTAVSLANNHSYDFGIAGYNHTNQRFEAADIVPLGHPLTVNETSVAMVPTKFGTLAVVGINYTYQDPDPEVVEEMIRTAKTKAELVVAYVHWGPEYQLAPSTKQIEQATLLAANGVDLIIGHHPHVIQPLHYIEGVPVLYSLGNTVFDQYFSEDVQVGLLVGLVSDGTDWGVRLYPISSLDSRHQPQLVSGAEKDRILTTVLEGSNTTLEEYMAQELIFLQ